MTPKLAIVAVIISAFVHADATAQFQAAYAAYEKAVAADDLSTALVHAKEAHTLGVELFGKNHANSAALALNHGQMLLDSPGPRQQQSSRNLEALRVLQQAKKRYRKVYGKKAEQLIDVEMLIAKASDDPRHFDAAIKLAAELKSAHHPMVARLNVEAGAHLLTHNGWRAEDYLERGYEIYLDGVGVSDVRTALAGFWLGKLCMAQGDHAAARPVLESALAAFTNEQQTSNPLELTTRAFLIEVYEQLGKSDLATQHCLAIGRMTPWDPNSERQPLFRRAPRYPQSAMQTGREGAVVIEFTVDTSGSVKNAQIVDTKGGAQFGIAALEAIESWGFAPRFVDGEAVDTHGVRIDLQWD